MNSNEDVAVRQEKLFENDVAVLFNDAIHIKNRIYKINDVASIKLICVVDKKISTFLFWVGILLFGVNFLYAHYEVQLILLSVFFLFVSLFVKKRKMFIHIILTKPEQVFIPTSDKEANQVLSFIKRLARHRATNKKLWELN